MTPAARIQATLELLQEIEDTPRPADALTSAYFRARRFIGSKDRAAISTRLYAILRHKARLDWWLARELPRPSRAGVGGGGNSERIKSALSDTPLPAPPREGEGNSFSSRVRLLAWLALGEGLTLKNIGELCSGGKFAPEALEESERVILRKLEGGTSLAGQGLVRRDKETDLDHQNLAAARQSLSCENRIEHPDMPQEIMAECPPDLVEPLKKRFGKNFMREMRAMLTPAPLDLRINILKTTREEILKALSEIGLKAEVCKISPWGIRVFERPSLNALPMLKNGLVEIQDEGSQMVALAVDAKPGERIVDFCAGAGGKTLAIGAMMQNKGKIIACDVLAARLKRSTERFRKAGLHNIETRALTGERDPWVKKHKGSYDRVLCDAPCSGTGTWRRNPDARWRNLGPELETLVKLQAEILDSASRLVKPGGRLVYATCSLLPDENEDQIEKFLAAHPEFTRVDCGLDGAPYLSLTPAQHSTDGFFAAVMVKAKSIP